MKLQCQFEQDLLDAVSSRRWPDRADAALRAHVASCSLCSDVAVIAGAFFEDSDCARAEAVVPPASAIWWRAQIRAREEATRVATRPLIAVQIVATLVALVAAIAVAPAASASIRSSIKTLGATDWWVMPTDFSLSWVVSAAAYTTLPLIAVGVWIVLAPVVVFLALDE